MSDVTGELFPVGRSVFSHIMIAYDVYRRSTENAELIMDGIP